MATDVSGMSREKKLAILSKEVHAARAEREAQGQMPDPRQKIPIAQSAGSVTYQVREPLSALTSRIVAATQRQAQRKKQNTMESRLDDALPSRSEDSVKQAADDAQRRLQNYTHSPAVQKRMRQQDEADTMANDAWDDPNQPQRDETLTRLQQEAKQAQADYDDAQRKEADQNVYDKDMADISALSEEEQQQLADYVSVRDQGTTGNPITDLIYLPIRKKKAAGGLLEKFGEARLNELAETYARDLHKQTKQEVQAAAQENAQGAGKAALSTAGNIIASPIGSIMGVKGRLDEMGNSTGRYSTLESYTPGDAINVYGDAAKQAVTKQIEGENPNFFRQSAAILYQAGTGALESAAKAITLGPAAAASTSAMGQYTRTLSEASERGATAQQATLLASANAALDYAMDKIPLDRLFGLAKSGSNSALKAALKQAGIEASTEGASFIGSQLLDMAILQQNSEYAQSIQNYMLQGLTQQEATAQANKDLLSQAWQQALVGGISGGVSAGVSTAIGNARTRRAEKAANAAMQDTNPSETEANAPIQQPTQQQPEPTQTAPESPLDTVSRMVRESTAQRQQEQQAARQSIQDQVAAMTGNAPDPGDVDQLDTFGQHTRQDVADPMQDRPYSEASKRSTKAYMYDNPEVKPYFQEQAAWLLNELQDTTRGEKSFNADAYYRTGGEGGITGTSRHTSDSIAELLDQDGLSYDQIERGLYAILNDNGAENNAASKKIEYVINDRLMNGYTDFYSGERIGSDENYLNLLKQQQADPSVGAADQNFTGTARYQELLSDDNVKPARRDDFRDDEVPEMDGSKRVSDVAKNLMGSKNTTDAGADQVKQLIDSGIFSYDKKSNKQSLQEAYNDLNARGADAVRTEINRHLKDGVIADGDIEKAVTLANQYIRSGDNEAAKDVISDLSLLAQKSGRNLQLFSLIRRMTPEGQLDVIQSAADKMLSGGKQSKKSKAGKSDSGSDSASKITADIPVELKNNYLEAARSKDPQRIDEATRAIAQVVGSQYKATWKEKWDTWRYMCMLGNVSTNVRNVAGNAMMKPYAFVKDKMSALFESALPQEKRTKALVTDRDLLEWAKEDTKSIDAQNALKYSAKMGADVTQDVFSENKRIFKTGALEKARHLTEWAPSAGDMLFKNGYYAKYLANFLTARGVSAEDVRAGKVDSDLMSQARQYAVDNAYINTFNDSNNFSDAIASVGKWKASTNSATRAFGTAIDGVLPFRRTPANILVRFKEYSPLEFINAAVKVHNKEDASSVINSIASGLTGSAAMGIGAALGHGIFDKSGNGIRLITKATEEEKLQGKQDWSVEITHNGKTWSVTMDWAAPSNLPLFVGTNIYNAISQSVNDGSDALGTVLNFVEAGKDTLEPMLALSCLSSVNDLLENVKYSEDGSYIYKIAASTATSYLTQGIPSLLRQTATFFQTEKQTTFANDDRKLVRDAQRTVSNIPFVGDKLGLKTDKIDVWGQKVSTGNIGERAFNAYLNPSKISRVKSDATTAELDRLSKTEYGTGVAPELAPKTLTYTDKQGLTHKDVRLTASQWETYATTRGQTSKAVLDRLVKSSDYAKLGDAGKAAVIDLVYKYADKTGAIKAMSDHDGYPETWMQEAFDSKNPGKYIIQKVNNQQMKTAMDNLTKAWAHKTERPAAKKDLETAYETYSKSSADVREAVMEAAEGTVKKYMEGRAQGMKSDTMLSIIKQVQSIPEKNRQKAAYQYQAITSTKGLSESQVDTAMKLYMKDGSSTELKYDYIRQEMGYSAQDYATIQKAYSTADANFGDGNGKVKKNEALAALEDIGYSPADAANIYNLLWGNTGKMKESLAKFEKSRQ